MDFLLRAFAPPDGTPVAPEAVPGDAGAGAGGFSGLIIWLVVLVGMFYFLIIMPQRRRDKQFKSMMSTLKVGDKIVTIGGIIGRVTSLNEQTVEITVANSSKLEITRRSVASILGKTAKDPNEAIERK